ncbi:hypothetical protein ASU35_09175 [Acetivibrio ethanolgignens]|uniref:Recombinase zinc beta ribbon domain-containing protein n=1 Tax=Acetivibrio ethanolgignens TaxID=290052 RepID=A0A0V8QFN1_9FIRM|nr:hypothetical protein ASU35_09175 [Acetivibrio ethanolgignens]
MNEWYVRDTSRKIKAVLRAKGLEGKPLTSSPLTGLIYCADCGAKMFNHRTKGYEKKDKNDNPTGKFTHVTKRNMQN